MNPNDVRATQDRRCDGCGSGESRLFFGAACNKGLARRAHQHRILQGAQFTQAGENFRVLFLAFAEAQTRIHHNPRPLHARALRPVSRSFQVATNCAHKVRQWAQLAPGLRSTAHMVQHKARIRLRHHFGQIRIESEAAGIVDDLNAIFKCTFGGFPFVGIEGNRHAKLIFQAFQNRHQAAPLFFG